MVILCVAENINMVMQDDSYYQLLQASLTRKMLQQIAGEGLIEVNIADFYMTVEQIAEATASIGGEVIKDMKIDDLKDQALLRKGRVITEQTEAIIMQMMGQRCSRLAWANNQDLTRKDEGEKLLAISANVRMTPLPGVRSLRLNLSRTSVLSPASELETHLSAQEMTVGLMEADENEAQRPAFWRGDRDDEGSSIEGH